MSHARLAPWRERGGAVCDGLARPLVGLGLWVGRVTSWLVLLVMLAVLTTVTLNALGINQIAAWQNDVLLFGKALTINSVTELQWHLFGILTLLGGTYALHHDSHVRVDLIYQKLSPRGRAVIDILGRVVILLVSLVLGQYLLSRMSVCVVQCRIGVDVSVRCRFRVHGSALPAATNGVASLAAPEALEVSTSTSYVVRPLAPVTNHWSPDRFCTRH